MDIGIHTKKIAHNSRMGKSIQKSKIKKQTNSTTAQTMV